jgi:fused signal recognition particle receptor
MGIFDKLKETLKSSFGGEKLEESLSKTRRGFIDKVVDVFTGREIDDDFYDELEELLIQGDVGVNTSINLVENIRARADRDRIKTTDQLKEVFVNEISELMGKEQSGLNLRESQLNIILVVGVNGAGKTTSIGN